MSALDSGKKRRPFQETMGRAFSNNEVLFTNVGVRQTTGHDDQRMRSEASLSPLATSLHGSAF